MATLTLLCCTSALAASPTEFGTDQLASQPRGMAINQETGDAFVADTKNNRIVKFSAEGEFLLAFGWGVATGAQELQSCGPQASPPHPTCGPGLPGAGAGQFQSPAGIAVDNSGGASQNDVYVADAGNARVEKFSAGGEFLLSFAASYSGFTPIAVAPSASVYLATSGAVNRFSETGAPEGELTLPGSGAIQTLAVDSTGDIYATSEENGVHKYDPAGTELGKPRDPAAQNGAIAVGPADELFLVDRRGGVRHVFAYDSAGAQISSFDATPENEPVSYFIGGLAFGEGNGALYLLDYAKNAVRTAVPPSPGPFVVLGSEAATAIGTTSATLGATINPEGGEGTTYEFEYGTEAGVYTHSTPVTPLPLNEVQSLTVVAEGGTFTLSFEGEPSAAILFNATAAEVQSALEAISSIGAGNVAVTGPAAGPFSIEFTAALAAADVAELLPDPTNLSGEDPSATILTTSPGHGRFEDRLASAAIAGLQPRATYHFRVLATNATAETTVGPDQTFETLPPVSVDSTSATQVTSNSALLEAELNPHGLPTTYHFEYDTVEYTEGEPAHGTSTPAASAGEGSADLAVSALAQGLASATTYHYRVVAENELGATDGPDRSFTTQASTVAPFLPDARQWQLVSPPDKNGIALEGIAEEGGAIQAAAAGSGLAYIATGAVGAGVPGNRSASYTQLLSTRTAAGWSTANIATPHEGVVGIEVGSQSEYKLFSEELETATVQPSGATPLAPEATERTPYLRLADGRYLPLVHPGNVPPGTAFGGTEGPSEHFAGGVEFVAGTPDLSHLILLGTPALTPDAPANGTSSLYEWSAGALQLISEIPPSSSTVCGDSLPACSPAAETGIATFLGAGSLNGGQRVRHAISASGQRVVFADSIGPSESHLYLRDVAAAETVQLDAPEEGVVGGEPPQDPPQFQTASDDGSRIFFTAETRLTPDSGAARLKPDLYMCQITNLEGHLHCSLRDLTPKTSSGESAAVLGAVIGADEAGRYLYFVANGALTAGEGAVPGDCQVGSPTAVSPAASCNLYRYDIESADFTHIALLSNRDSNIWGGGNPPVSPGHLTARVSPDGDWLAFMSQRPLTGYDNRDAVSGERDEEVFLYHHPAAGPATLICPSCNPTGARPVGALLAGKQQQPLYDRPGNWTGVSVAASIPGWTTLSTSAGLHQSRYLSDSGRLFFNAVDGILPADSNGTADVYEYEPSGVGACAASTPGFAAASQGCLGLISAGTSGDESAFLDASENGDDVFFLTTSRLAPTDVDHALDVYDAHVCTAEVSCLPTPPTSPPNCEGDACQPPATPPAHPTPGTTTLNGPGNLLQCPKGKVKNQGKCVKKRQQQKNKHKKKGKKKNSSKGKKQKRANSRHGGHK